MEAFLLKSVDKLRKVVEHHFYLGNCSQKEKTFLLSNVYNYVVHFYIIWKILKNPPVGRPIVAGYKWSFTPASIFVGHFLKRFYSKFDSILNDSLSLVKLLENNHFDKKCFLFTIDFKSLYTNIPVNNAIKCIHKLFLITKMSFQMLIYQQATRTCAKQQRDGFRLRMFSTNIWFNHGDKCGTNFDKYVHGCAGIRITTKVQIRP